MPSNNKKREKGLVIRRIFHLSFAFVVLYYYFPSTFFGLPTYYYLIIFLIILPFSIEINRLNKNTLFIGLHEHEKDHVASYLWFTFGATILLLFFPQQIAAPCIVATSLGDPVIGLTKQYRRRYMISVTFFVCLIVFLFFNYEIFIALFAAAVAFIAESFEFKIRIRLRPNIFWSRSKRKISKYRQFFDFLFRTDDDFIMQLLPAVTLYIFFLLFPQHMPEVLLNPLPELLPFA